MLNYGGFITDWQGFKSGPNSLVFWYAKDAGQELLNLPSYQIFKRTIKANNGTVVLQYDTNKFVWFVSVQAKIDGKDYSKSYRSNLQKDYL